MEQFVMPQPHLPAHKIRKLLHRYAAGNLNKAQTATTLRIARSTATRYIDAFKKSYLSVSEIDRLPRAKLVALLFPNSPLSTSSQRKLRLLARLPLIHSRIELDGLSVLAAWREEISKDCNYKYSQFASLYAAWRLDHGHNRILRPKKQQITAKSSDYAAAKRRQRSLSRRKLRLLARLPSIHSRIETDGLSVLTAWREEIGQECDYKYSQFASLYAAWRSEHGHTKLLEARKQQFTVKSSDYDVLRSWQRSHDRRKWEVGIGLLGLSSGHTLSWICNKIGRARRTVTKWCVIYDTMGIDALPVKRSRRLSEETQAVIKEKKIRLIKIIHETPKCYGINRASWSLKSLSDAYKAKYDECVSRSSVSEYFIAAGYRFKKAKKSLMSADPTYRDKLNNMYYLVLGQQRNSFPLTNLDLFP
jgi:transposase